MDGAVHTYGHRSRKGIYRRWPVQIRFPRPVFVWLLLLLTLVLFMAAEFKKSDKAAALLQIPYILWLCFAGYLNLVIYLLNG